MPNETPQQRLKRIQSELFNEFSSGAPSGGELLPLVIPRSPAGQRMVDAQNRVPELLTERESGIRQLTRMREAQQNSPRPGSLVSGLADTALETGLNSALFGNLPRIVGAVGGPQAEEFARQDIEAGARLNPGTAAAASFGGAFLPPGGPISSGVARGSSRAIGPVTRAIQGAGTVEHALARRASARLIENAVGGSSALLAYNILKDKEERTTLIDRLHETGEQILSPVNLGLTATATALQARLGREIDREMLAAGLRFERESGVKLPVESFMANSANRATYRTLAQLPGRIRHRVARQEDRIIEGISEELDQIARRVSGRGFDRNQIQNQTSAPAADAIRRIAGVAETRNPGELQRASTQAFESGVATLANGLDELVPMTEMRTLRAAIRDIRSSRPNTENSRIDTILKRLDKISTFKSGGSTLRVPITLRDLEGLKKNLGFYRRFKDLIGTRPQDRTRFEAGQLYDVISGIERRAFPDFANAIDDVSRLKQMQESLPQRATIDVDDRVIAEFFKPGKGMLKRWEAAQAMGMPGDVDVLRGHYISSLLEEVADQRTGAISPTKLMSEFRKANGKYNRQAFDRIIPGGEQLRRELFERAQLHERIFKETRIATSGRDPSVALTVAGGGLAAAGAAASTVSWVLSNPYTMVPMILGPIGLQVMITRSLVGGRAEGLVRRSTLGGAPVGASAVAAQQVSGTVPSRELPSLPTFVPTEIP